MHHAAPSQVQSATLAGVWPFLETVGGSGWAVGDSSGTLSVHSLGPRLAGWPGDGAGIMLERGVFSPRGWGFSFPWKPADDADSVLAIAAMLQRQGAIPRLKAGANVTITRRADEYEIAAAAGGGSSATTVEADLGATAVFRGAFTITDAAIGPTSKVLCWQAPGPYTGKGTRADEAEMQPVMVIAVEPAAGNAVVKWQTPPTIVHAIQLHDGKRDAPGATFDRLSNQRWPDAFTPRRIGRVRGNVKFSYMVLA
jgi:hypothetical protein